MRSARWLLVTPFLLAVASAQVELFDVVRYGTVDEVRRAVGAATAPTILVDQYGQDLLVYAASTNGDPQVVDYLVSAGFNVNMTTPQGWTALMYAVLYNPNCAVTLMLLDLGADVGLRNADGERAIDLLDRGPNPSCGVSRLAIAVAPFVPLTPPTSSTPPAQRQTCCKYCSTGKACGDSCISRSYTCRRGAGCACNAVVPIDPIVIAGAVDTTKLVTAVAGCIELEGVHAFSAQVAI